MPEDIQKTLRLLLQEVKEILGDRFLGMYAHGSLAMGDFNPGSSDVDFMVVTQETVSDSVLTMCRVLYTLNRGDLCSKRKAAQWAREYLGEDWSALIDEALEWKFGKPFDHLPQVLDLIRLTLEHARSEP